MQHWMPRLAHSSQGWRQHLDGLVHVAGSSCASQELQNRKRSDPLGDIDFDLVVEGCGMPHCQRLVQSSLSVLRPSRVKTFEIPAHPPCLALQVRESGWHALRAIRVWRCIQR
eukprot:4050000-Amphidinium_carterae.1